MNLVVEFLGSPGVGKSTLIPAVVRRLADLSLASAPTTSRSRKLYELGRYVVGHPRSVACSLRAIAGMHQRTPADLVWVTRTWLKRCARHATLRALPGIHVVDAGLAQSLWSIGSRAARPIDPALADLPLPDLVLVVEASTDTVARRLAGRPGQQSRLEREGDDLRRARDRVHEVCELLRSRAIALTTIDNDQDDVESASAAAAAAIRRICSG